MKAHLASLLTGAAAAAGIAALWEWKRNPESLQPMQRAARSAGRAARAVASLDLNTASREQLAALPGITGDVADRIIDNRPYRNKLDLLARLVVPEDIYNLVKPSLSVGKTSDAVMIAS